MHRVAIWIAVTVAAVTVAACGGARGAHPTPTAPPPAPSSIVIPRGQPIVIGVSAALSGDQANLGRDIADAADLAAGDRGGTLKGHPLKVQRLDDGCTNAENAVDVAHSLIKIDTLVGVVGPMCTTGAQAADKVYEAAAVVHISPAATRIDLSTQGERYFFRTAWRDDAQAATQSQFAAGTLKASSAVLVDDGEPYGKTLADAFAAAFAQAGGHIAMRERIDRGTVEFSALAQQVKSASPDAVVFEGLNPEGALLVKALRDAGYAGSFIAPDGLLSVRDFIAPGGAAAEGTIVTGGATPDDAFSGRFKDRFQRMPTTPFVLQSYDAVNVLLEAVASAATEAGDGALVIDRARLADALRAQRFAGLTGPIQFDENGDRRGDTAAELGLAIYRVVNGRFEKVQ